MMPCRCNSASVASASETDNIAGTRTESTSGERGCGCGNSSRADTTAVLETRRTNGNSDNMSDNRGRDRKNNVSSNRERDRENNVAGTKTSRPNNQFWPDFVEPPRNNNNNNNNNNSHCRPDNGNNRPDNDDNRRRCCCCCCS